MKWKDAVVDDKVCVHLSYPSTYINAAIVSVRSWYHFSYIIKNMMMIMMTMMMTMVQASVTNIKWCMCRVCNFTLREKRVMLSWVKVVIIVNTISVKSLHLYVRTSQQRCVAHVDA